MPNSRGIHAASILDGKIYAIGGFDNSTGFLATVEEFTVPYSIMASAGNEGSISPSGHVPVNSGADQAFTITPNPGYCVADVLVDNASQGQITSYTFTNVTDNHTISASFAVNTCTTAVSSGANGGRLTLGRGGEKAGGAIRGP